LAASGILIPQNRVQNKYPVANSHPLRLSLDELYDVFERIRSYAVSGIEAARRGDRAEVRLRLRVQLRDAFRYAVSVHNLLSPPVKGGES
jgi:hypothetical protein